jgi:hypothetical protein
MEVAVARPFEISEYYMCTTCVIFCYYRATCVCNTAYYSYQYIQVHAATSY